jgi:glycosyltransferase involved in cell wall biosynthesis
MMWTMMNVIAATGHDDPAYLDRIATVNLHSCSALLASRLTHRVPGAYKRRVRRSTEGGVVHVPLLVLAALTTVGLAVACVDFVVGHRRLRWLGEVAAASTASMCPSVSIVAAARNEARGIEAAVTSFLGLDYPGLEIVVVDDRSTDQTGAILERLARRHVRLRIKRVVELPGGWLGKNHALAAGAADASGELLLFTDADVVFEPTTLRRAVMVMEQDRLDHLTAIPDARVPGFALSAFVAAFGVFFSMYARPWKVRDPRSRAHIGVGAFNLIRARAYRAIGTHRAIRMRPDDDIKLGKLVKKCGFRQDVVSGRDFVVVEWYGSLGELIDGLMKNAFAGLNYSLVAVAGGTAALFVMNVWPFLAVAVTEGVTRLLNAVSVLLIAVIFRTSTRCTGSRFGYVVAFPAAALLFMYIIWRSALLAVVSGRVTWRGTDYPLAEMRANRV